LTAQEAVDYGLVDKVLEPSKDSILAEVQKVESGDKDKPEK
jgi:ATP-dependent protease ClpP protease subunit